MSDSSTITVLDPKGKARQLYEARSTLIPIAPFTDSEPHLTLADGYAIQRELISLLLADGDSILGYKVGLTSRPMQVLIGVDSPDFGPVLASTRYPNGAGVRIDRFISPKMEAEISVVMGQRLQGPGVTVDDARLAISHAKASMEIVDSRVVDWRVRLADTVADLASNGALVLSEEAVPIDGIDLRLIGMVLTNNGQLVDTGVGAAALGDPVAVVAWLANVLGEHGLAIEAGQVVMTGALHAAVPLSVGDNFVAQFDRLGTVSMRVTSRCH